MSIYTKKGDKGSTSLLDKRVSKSDCRVEALGNLDELNSFLGLAASFSGRQSLKELLQKIQNHIFRIQAEIAITNPAENLTPLKPISDKEVSGLEKAIDKIEKNLPPLNKFILPQGARDSATLHVARTICRRTERSLVKANEDLPFANPAILKYINRLSDLLFVLARYSNKINNVSDIFPDYYERS